MIINFINNYKDNLMISQDFNILSYYDYSKVDYKGSDIPVLIIDPKRNNEEFWQKPKRNN